MPSIYLSTTLNVTYRLIHMKYELSPENNIYAGKYYLPPMNGRVGCGV